mgnify:CR=1 FL=1
MKSRNNLMDLKTALNQIHFPTNLEQAQKAKLRFSFEELFLLQLILKLNRNENKKFVFDGFLEISFDSFDKMPANTDIFTKFINKRSTTEISD